MKRKIKDSAVRLFLFNLLKDYKKELAIIVAIARLDLIKLSAKNL